MISRRRLAILLAVFLGIAVLARHPAASAGENPFGPRGLRFGYHTSLFSEVSRADAQAALSLWARELTRIARYDVETQMIFFDDLDAFVSAIRAGEVDFIALTSLDYLEIRDRVAMELALTGERNGRAGDEQLLLVRRDSGIRELSQLRGKRLVFLRGGSGRIASLWLDTMLAKHGLPAADAFFGAAKEAERPQQVLLSLFFGQADACLVGRNAFATAAELNPQVGKDLQVLTSSPAYPLAVTCFRKSLTRAEKEEFIHLSFRMLDFPSGRQILTLFKVDKIARSTPAALDGLAELVRESKGSKTALKGKTQ